MSRARQATAADELPALPSSGAPTAASEIRFAAIVVTGGDPDGVLGPVTVVDRTGKVELTRRGPGRPPVVTEAELSGWLTAVRRELAPGATERRSS